MGLASAVAHLEQSPTKSKVVILLTDGANNTGDISPLMAAELAKKCHIRIYTILLGSEGKVNVPVAQLPNGEVYSTQMDATADPTTLQQIAQATGGTFYRATSRNDLKKVYQDIDKLEKQSSRSANTIVTTKLTNPLPSPLYCSCCSSCWHALPSSDACPKSCSTTCGRC